MHPEIEAYLAANPEPQSIDVLIADANGILRGKQFPGSGLSKLFKNGANFPLSLMFCDIRGATAANLLQPPLTGDPDVAYMPVAGTLRPVPWATVPTAQIMLRPVDTNGKPHPLDPLTVLEKQIKSLNASGMNPVAALEGEFYLLDPSTTPPSPLKSANGWPDFEGPQVYALEPLRDVQGFIDQIKQVAAEQGIALTSVVCEYGASQFEMNLNHSADLVSHCYEFLMLKHAIRNIAAANGQLASFMAVPLSDQAGSGCHVHVSVVDNDGTNIFGEDDNKLRHAVGGLLETMPDSLALCAPFANSYRRFGDDGWSPNTGNWGHNHRLVSLRIPSSGTADKRIEHRIAGADVNPILLVASVLAGIKHGIENSVDPGAETVEGQQAQLGIALPTRWREALRALDGSDFFRAQFGSSFVEMFLRGKYTEEESFHAEVSDRDLGWCLRTV